jgi:hypothetical protein
MPIVETEQADKATRNVGDSFANYQEQLMSATLDFKP